MKKVPYASLIRRWKIKEVHVDLLGPAIYILSEILHLSSFVWPIHETFSSLLYYHFINPNENGKLVSEPRFYSPLDLFGSPGLSGRWGAVCILFVFRWDFSVNRDRIPRSIIVGSFCFIKLCWWDDVHIRCVCFFRTLLTV